MPEANSGPQGRRPLPKDSPLNGYSQEAISRMAEALAKGQMTPELEKLYERASKGQGPDGKPQMDEEGGVTIQPEAGFVVKSKNQHGGKVFINMTKHEIVDPFENKAIPQQDQEKFNTGEQGLRIPLSMGEMREEFDKKGEPAQVFDVIWSPETVDQCMKEPAFRQAVIELAFGYIDQKYNI